MLECAMRFAFFRKTAVVMLVAFLASFTTSAFAMADPVQAAQHEIADAGHDGDEGGPASEQDHEKLHAAAQVQPCPLAFFKLPAHFFSGVVTAALLAPAVAHATAEAPFRPPRISSPPA